MKWTLILNPSYDCNKQKELLQTKRRFSSIHLRGDIAFDNISKYFTQCDIAFLSAVTSITISQTTFQLSEFNSLLKMFPSLENVVLSSVKLPKVVKGDHLNENDKPESFKKLSFGYNTDDRLLQCFTNSKLTKLICRDQHFTRSTVWKFLSTQSELQEIDFRRTASNATFEFGIEPSQITFKLKHLALDYKSVADFNGIVELLLLQLNTLKTVELGHIPDLSVYTTIFANLKNLTTLHLMPGSVQMRMNNDLILQPLWSVTNLRLYDGVNYGLTSTQEMTIKIIENLPNLEDLELFVPYKQIYYQSIVTNLKKLKSLTIRVTFDTKLKNLKFPCVEKLRINCFNFLKYRLRHSPISMVVEDENAEINEAVRSFTYEGIVNEELLDFIRNIFPKLDLLVVRKDLAKFEHTKITGIRQVTYREENFFTKIIRFS